MTCGGHDIRTVGEVADDREYAIVCFDCGTTVVIALHGFLVSLPRRAKRSRPVRRAIGRHEARAIAA